MPNLETLFNNHVADLMDMFPSISNTFICPICKNPYSLEDIASEKLSLGDVWTNYVREKIKNNLINKHVVLLCKDCNSLAGQYGDAQSQLFEQIKDGESTGNLYGMRSIQIKKANENPIAINANISIENATNTITMSGKVNKNAQWLNNDPKMQQRFLQLVENKEPVSFFVDAKLLGTIKPKPELAPVGWITSAYLFAFYTFGYRYVLHPSLDSVREYILNSFNETSHRDIKSIPGMFDIREYDDKYFDYPEMDLIVPLDNKEPVFLQINVLRYQINLPFNFVPSVLSTMIYSRLPDFQERLPKLRNSKSVLYFQIKQKKIGGEVTVLDYLLGKPFPPQSNR